MPEKPEVMTVVEKLKPKLLGKKITGCNVYYENIIKYPTVNEFKENIINQVINNIDTRGKYIVVKLNDYKLLIHLRMEGKFTFRKVGDLINKHEHVEFILDNNISFRYHDVRKFGTIHLIKDGEILKNNPLEVLGLDYYDKNLNGEYLYNKIDKLSKNIKTVLLDQSIICGIGNIYVNEILFDCGILPNRKCNNITLEECNNIVSSTRKILDKAYKLGGTTIRSFTSSEGVHGLFQNELMIHGKENEKCIKCGNMIIKEKLNGRGTYYCRFCQR